MKHQIDLRWISLPYSFYKVKDVLERLPKGEDLAVLLHSFSLGDIKEQLVQEGYMVVSERQGKIGEESILIVQKGADS